MGCKDIGITKSEFVTKTQLICPLRLFKVDDKEIIREAIFVSGHFTVF